MTAAFRGGWGLYRGDAATGSTTWTKIAEIIGVSGLGAQASDIQVTNCDSGNSHEYIAGLLDGVEITAEANLVITNAVQQAMTADAQAGNSWEFQVPLTDGTDTITITFEASVKGWQVNPSNEEQNKIQWNVKLSGTPTVAYS